MDAKNRRVDTKARPHMEADLSGLRLGGVDLSRVDRREIKLLRARITCANLESADLRGIDLSGEDLSGVKLRRANFRGSSLSGVRFIRADLSGADLRGADLGGADLTGAQLIGADLSEVYLRDANVCGASLTGATLCEANLSEAAFQQACLTSAKLIGAKLSGTNLNRADLSGATLSETVFGNTNLRDAKGLHSCKHLRPSSIDHRTLAKSGQLPLSFLRGCGLSDWQLEVGRLNQEPLSKVQISEIVQRIAALRYGQPIDFHSCFISHSTENQEFAERLHADLQDNGVRCWYAGHDIKAGRKIHQQIDDAIQTHDRLLLILSEASMNSEWVKAEVANARSRELRTGHQVLFPISLVPFGCIRKWQTFDADAGKDSAREVREYFIPDFSNWRESDSYQKAFVRLLSDLRCDGAPGV